ncbi:MAG: amidohydrolase family protein [Planctomycetes bacterium]|nr:amidohydrolase family protein [Planctomycetota bacterium]
MIAASFLLAALPLQEEVLHLHVDQLLDGRGGQLEQALVVIKDGKIDSITQGDIPEGAIHVPEAVLTPGLVDAYSLTGVTARTVDERSESTPTSALVMTAQLDADGFQSALREGVTSTFVSPDSANVIGGLAVAVKTAGGPVADLFADANMGAKVVRGNAALKVSLGEDPSGWNSGPRRMVTDVFVRRPTTRMGVVWVMRQEFHRAIAYREAGLGGTDPEMDMLVAAMAGDVPIRVHARRAHDIQTALRLQKEFGWPNMILEDAGEGHMVAELLAEAGVPVVVGPSYDEAMRSINNGPSMEELRMMARPPAVCCEHSHGPGEHEDHSGVRELPDRFLEVLLAEVNEDTAPSLANGRMRETKRPTPSNPGLLAAAGVQIAFGAVEGHGSAGSEASVIHLARQAVRWGMDPQLALQACTSTAADLCGLGAQTGSIEAGKDADLVLWSGDPLSTGSKPVLVIVDGRIVVDQRG